MAIKIKKGDTVFVIAGKDKGRKGKITRTLPKAGKIVVEGMNIRKKHTRPRRSGQKGQIIEITSPMDMSNVMLVCPKCGKPTRVGYRIENTEKIRICKKCNEQI